MTPAPIKLSSPATREFWEIPVLFEDEHLLALDKPAGVLPTSQTLKPGIHFVKVTRVGFASWTSSVTVSPGSRVELPVLMRPVAAGGGGPTPRPIYKRWWFWTVIGAVVAAGATTGIYFAARPAAPPSMPQLDLR